MDLKHYRLVGYQTLTDALTSVLQSKSEKKPWIIASLNGQRYFIFKSSASFGQQLYNAAAKKVKLNAEIEQNEFKRLNPGITPTAITPAAVRDRAHDLDNLLGQTTADGWSRQDGGAHDAEYLIANWPECVAQYKQFSSHPLKTVDLFMSHTPCTVYDDRPSIARTIDGVRHEKSCMTKLKYFVKEHKALKWRLYYREKFGYVADQHWEDSDVTAESEWLNLSKLSGDIVQLITTIQAGG